jgi:beta-N-acetylhexosaminidase
MTLPIHIPLGPLMLDIPGKELTPDDIRRLTHPLTGGVILFTRNYASPEQLAHLTAEIHALRAPPLLIGVDHEGGRVQRFRQGFTAIPAMGAIGAPWDAHPLRARHLARDAGFILASELRAHGVDFSFAPVVDLDYGVSRVIGDRALHADPAAVAELATALMLGMREAGMAACAKHFPGHGFASADSHVVMPVDERDAFDIDTRDLFPYRQLIDNGLPAAMPAHVVYPRVDDRPAGFSRRWLHDILRGQLGFQGVIFSDDLTMEGAAGAGDIVARTRAALAAGCDMALICNRPDLADQTLARLDVATPPASLARFARMHGATHAPTLTALRESPRHAEALRHLAGLGQASGDLALADPTLAHVIPPSPLGGEAKPRGQAGGEGV